MKKRKTQDEIQFELDCRRVSIESVDILGCIEGREDLEEALEALKDLQSRVPRTKARDGVFEALAEMAKQVAETF